MAASDDRPQVDALLRRCVEEVANAIDARSGPLWTALRSSTNPPAPVATLYRLGFIASLRSAWRGLVAACSWSPRLTPEQRARRDAVRAAAKERL